MSLNLDDSCLLKCFIKMKPKLRLLKMLFGMGKYNYFTVPDEGRISKDSRMPSIRKGSLWYFFPPVTKWVGA